MKFHNYDIDNSDNDFKQFYDFMPNSTFRMLRANPCKNQTLHGRVKKLKFAVLLHTGRL